MTKSTTIIITAGGIGKRMEAKIPKQFIKIGGKPILLHTLEALYKLDSSYKFIITLPSDWVAYWKDELQSLNCNITHSVTEGGKERYHSIKNALKHVDTDYVLIHDAVRPLVSTETLSNIQKALEHKDAVIPVTQLTDSIRKTIGDKTEAVDRADFVNVQTPQGFHTKTLKSAYQIPFHKGITDDASLVEQNGTEIATVEGNIENIKITTPIDLIILSHYVNKTQG